MRLLISLATLGSIMTLSAHAGIPVVGPTSDQMRVLVEQMIPKRLTDGNVLMTDADPSQARLAQCQPVKGDKVMVLETKSNVTGIHGLNVARVIVTSGDCMGIGGWVGLLRLER